MKTYLKNALPEGGFALKYFTQLINKQKYPPNHTYTVRVCKKILNFFKILFLAENYNFPRVYNL